MAADGISDPGRQAVLWGNIFSSGGSHGRPSFARAADDGEAFEKRREEVEESAGSVMALIEQNETFRGAAGNPGPELVEKMV